MRIAVGADQRGDIDAIAADIADEIAEDREAGDDVEAILRRGPGQLAANMARAMSQSRIMATPRDDGRETSAAPGR